MSQNKEHLHKVLRMLLYEFAFDNNVIIVNLHHTAYLSKACAIIHWKVAPTFFSPKGITM